MQCTRRMGWGLVAALALGACSDDGNTSATSFGSVGNTTGGATTSAPTTNDTTDGTTGKGRSDSPLLHGGGRISTSTADRTPP